MSKQKMIIYALLVWMLTVMLFTACVPLKEKLQRQDAANTMAADQRDVEEIKEADQTFEVETLGEQTIPADYGKDFQNLETYEWEPAGEVVDTLP